MHDEGNACEAGRRVTLVIDALGAGGAQRVVTLMANAWASRGWRVTVLTFDNGGEAPFFELHPAVCWSPMDIAGVTSGVFARCVRFVRRIVALRRAIEASEPEIVISHMDRVNIFTLVASLNARFPIVAMVHEDPRRSSLERGWRVARGVLYPHADKVVVLTDDTLAQFPAAIQRKASVIPNPVVQQEGCRPCGENGPRQLVAMGRLERQKGFDLLLQAFARISDAHPEWQLTIWGEGGERGALESLALHLGLSQRVTMPGRTQEASRVLAEADLFVLSSRYEGFPMVLCEAMASGLPVVAFDCPSGPREIIRDGVDGVLVSPEDPVALAAALDRLMGDDAECRRLRAKAGEIVDRFGLRKIMYQWEEMLEALIVGDGDDSAGTHRSKGGCQTASGSATQMTGTLSEDGAREPNEDGPRTVPSARTSELAGAESQPVERPALPDWPVSRQLT